MQRPKWLSGWGKGKNLFEGSLIIDIPDIKVVETRFDKKLVLFAVGTSQPRVIAVSAERSVERIGDKDRFDMKWKIFYDPTALPDFIPVDKAWISWLERLQCHLEVRLFTIRVQYTLQAAADLPKGMLRFFWITKWQRR